MSTFNAKLIRLQDIPNKATPTASYISCTLNHGTWPELLKSSMNDGLVKLVPGGYLCIQFDDDDLFVCMWVATVEEDGSVSGGADIGNASTNVNVTQWPPRA